MPGYNFTRTVAVAQQRWYQAVCLDSRLSCDHPAITDGAIGSIYVKAPKSPPSERRGDGGKALAASPAPAGSAASPAPAGSAASPALAGSAASPPPPPPSPPPAAAANTYWKIGGLDYIYYPPQNGQQAALAPGGMDNGLSVVALEYLVCSDVGGLDCSHARSVKRRSIGNYDKDTCMKNAFLQCGTWQDDLPSAQERGGVFV